MITIITNNLLSNKRQNEIANASKRVRWNFKRRHNYLTQFKFNN